MRIAHRLLVCALLLGCEVRKRQPPEETSGTSSPEPVSKLTPADLSALRVEVIAQVVLFERPELTPTEPEIVDSHIVRAIDGGALPSEAKDRERVVWHASSALERWLLEDKDGIALLSKRIDDRYKSAEITRDGSLVRIDAGLVAGKPGTFRGSSTIDSPHVESGEWIASQVVTYLTLGMAAHADAQSYQAEVYIPARWSKGALTYVYDRADDRITVYSSDWSEAYATAKLDGKLANARELHHTKLTRQPIGKLPVRSRELGNKNRPR